MVRAVQQPVFGGDRGQSADDSLGGRVGDVGNIRRIRRVIGIEDNPALANDQQTVEAAACSELDQPGKVPPSSCPALPAWMLAIAWWARGLCCAFGVCAARRNHEHDCAENNPGSGKSGFCISASCGLRSTLPDTARTSPPRLHPRRYPDRACRDPARGRCRAAHSGRWTPDSFARRHRGRHGTPTTSTIPGRPSGTSRRCG